MSTRPDPLEDPFKLPSKQRLTTEDIKYTEVVINELLRNLLVNEELRERHIAMSLSHKIKGCIDIADYAAKEPTLSIGPELGQALRKLLMLVNDYYVKLN